MTVLDNVADTDLEGVRAACLVAVEARPRLVPIGHRAEVLKRLAGVLDADRDALRGIAEEETGLSPARLDSEIDRTVGQLLAFATAVRDGGVFEAVVEPGSPDLRRLHVPLGPVAVFAAANFPFAFSVLGGDTASALAAGCPVVVKAHPGHPRLSAAVAALAVDAAGPGVVQVVHGIDAGIALVRETAIRAVGFTGSGAGAAVLVAATRQRPDPIPFYGELGAVNPVVITRAALDRDADAIARGLVGSFTQSAGQLCTKPGIVFVPAGAGVAERVTALLGDAPAAPMLTPGIRDRFAAGVEALAAAPGIERLTDLAPADAGRVRPVLLRASAVDLPDLALQECFGPVTVLVEYGSTAEVCNVLERHDGVLCLSLHATASDGAEVARLLALATDRSGRVVFGGWPTGVAVSPAMNHGGPWPATTNALHSAVGLSAARRFLRPVCFQDAPDDWLPPELQDANPLGLLRLVRGVHTRDAVQRSGAGTG